MPEAERRGYAYSRKVLGSTCELLWSTADIMSVGINQQIQNMMAACLISSRYHPGLVLTCIYDINISVVSFKALASACNPFKITCILNHWIPWHCYCCERQGRKILHGVGVGRVCNGWTDHRCQFIHVDVIWLAIVVFLWLPLCSSLEAPQEWGVTGELPRWVFIKTDCLCAISSYNSLFNNILLQHNSCTYSIAVEDGRKWWNIGTEFK